MAATPVAPEGGCRGLQMPRADSGAARVPVRTATVHLLHMTPPCVTAMDDGFDFRPVSARGSLVKAPHNEFACGHVYGIFRSDLFQMIFACSKSRRSSTFFYSSPSCRGLASVVESISRMQARRGGFRGCPWKSRCGRECRRRCDIRTGVDPQPWW